jgi:hypothetical protein
MSMQHQETLLINTIIFLPASTLPRSQILHLLPKKPPRSIAHWKFDEGVGTTAYDSTNNNTFTTFKGTTLPTWASESDCISGKCLKFYGPSSYLESKNPYNFDLNNKAFTISIWFKANSLSVPDAPELIRVSTTNGWINLRVAYNNEVELHIKGNDGTVMEYNTPNNFIPKTLGIKLTPSTIQTVLQKCLLMVFKSALPVQ